MASAVPAVLIIVGVLILPQRAERVLTAIAAPGARGERDAG